MNEGLHIVWAIAAKDIADALKNRTILGNLIAAVLIIVAYEWFPTLVKDPSDTFLVVYDAGDSRLVIELENSPAFNPLRVTSMEQVERVIDDQDVREMGLGIPAGSDQILDSGRLLQLDGYVLWSNRFAANRLKLDLERQLTELVGQPVQIDIERILVPPVDTTGVTQPAAIMMATVTFILGVLTVPHLLFDEKEARTFDLLLVSPATLSQMVMGKALAGLFYCLTGVGIALAFNWAAVTSWGLVIVAATCGALFAVGLGLLLGITLDSRQQIMICSWVIGAVLVLPALFAGLAPFLPEALRTILPWIPTVAMTRLFQFSLTNGVTPGQVLTPLSVVLASTLLGLAVVAWRVRLSDR
jgi:ABC-type transport system involved in multi-copper enzyme maturation permease subunit